LHSLAFIYLFSDMLGGSGFCLFVFAILVLLGVTGWMTFMR
jgi:hypothetical protein